MFIVSVLPATIQALFTLGVPVLPKMGMRCDPVVPAAQPKPCPPNTSKRLNSISRTLHL
ncbi:MAG: hypothetical protein QOE48_6348 [Mycobacterium sp.]|nr:hypothetical protein [Mycobacterium sp.]